MKVLVHSRDFPPDFGGVQTWMERIARHYGEEAVVLTRRCPGFEDFDRQQVYAVKRLPRLDWKHDNRLLNILLRAMALFLRFALNGIYLAETIREQKTDVVHCAYVMANGLPMMVVRILTGTPYVVYCHGNEILREVDKGGVRLWLVRLILRLAVRVVVNSTFMRDEIARLVDPSRIVIAPLGADSGNLDPTAEPLQHLGGFDFFGREVIVTLGRIDPRKGHDMIVRALPAIVEKCPHALWIIVGEGEHRLHVERMVNEAGLGEHVLFAGKAPDDQLSAILARADLFLLPNRRIGNNIEGFGIVFLEAAMFGVPAVGGRSGGAVDAIDDGVTGLLCDGENPADIAAETLAILTDPELAETMRLKAKERAAQRTWASCCTVVEKAIQALLP
ncbi:MAG TPA: glycosyltransferase family 4 protein [bacterium]|nr:glycosyltransferase family 4 protein [bacterium]